VNDIRTTERPQDTHNEGPESNVLDKGEKKKRDMLTIFNGDVSLAT